MRLTLAAALATCVLSAPVLAGQVQPQRDPVRAATADVRQRGGESKLGQRMRNTRCKIIVQRGQDKRVCGVPSNRSPGDGRKK